MIIANGLVKCSTWLTVDKRSHHMRGRGVHVWGSLSLAMAFLTVTKGRERGGSGDAYKKKE